MRKPSRSLALSAAIGLALVGTAVYGSLAVNAAVPNPARDTATAEANTDNVYIITFVEAGLINYEGGIAGLARTAPDTATGKRLDRTSSAARTYEAWLETQRQSHRAALESTLGRALDVTHSYGITFNGIAAELTPGEAATLRTVPGVESVEAAGVYYLDTYRGPSFIGANKIWDGSATPTHIGNRGQGVKVGIIDGGANSGHPSFANDASCGFSSAAPKLTAKDCSSVSGGLCVGSNPQANSTYGHGVHTASTAAGNTIDNTVSPAPALPDGMTMSGVAPCATVYQYKVCATNSCAGADIAGGIQNAIADGVDVINFSISGGTSPWGSSDNDRRFLDAVGNGTFVAASAGNNTSTDPTVVGRVNHRGPWVMSVAASSHDQIVGPGLSLAGPGTPAPATQNVALNPGSTTTASSTPTWNGKPIRTHAANIEGCTDSGGIPAGTFTGSVAIVRRGTCAFTEKIANAYNAGADMVVIANNQVGSINMDTTGAPTVPAYSTNQASGDALIAAINANPSSSTANVAPIVSGTRLGDVLADFSYRGPTPSPLADLTKPDISGPGVDIYAATDPGSGQYEFMSGTSMAGPHVAGAGALMKGVHPTWSPMEIRSALMMTAKRDGFRENETSPWNIDDVGSGRVDVAKAAMAGLTMDETKANFLAANPSGGSINIKALNLPALRNLACNTSCTWTRTVRNRLATSGTWSVGSTTDGRFAVSASPSTFTLAADAEQTITFTASPTVTIPSSSIAFGYVTLTEANGLAPQQHLSAAIRGTRAATVYTVGGTVSGLTGTGLALALNGGDSLAVAANGSYVFPGGLPTASPYEVTIASQPTGQMCTVTNGLGSIAAANITNVDVSCVSAVTNWTVTPSVSGGNGVISPDTPQTVNDGGTTSFTLAANTGYRIDSVGGTCGGTLSGTTYTTNAITADCTVIASFAQNLTYCTRGYSTGVEPISLVSIDGINNPSPATGGPAYQDFTSIVGQLAPGASYPISVQGNTDGAYRSAVAVYFDWNRNGTFDSGEGYFIGALLNSTGADGQTVTAMIPVPATAAPGQTRMRVVKQYTEVASPGLAQAAACGAAGYGQAEDYTVNLDPSAPVPPTLSIAIAPASGVLGAPATLTMTLGNGSANPANLTADFTTALPSGLQLATPANASTTCSGTFTAADGSGSITLASGGAILPGGCTIEATLVSTAPRRYSVNTGTLSTNQGNAAAASAEFLAWATTGGATTYSTGFESPFTAGALNGQQGWAARSWNVATTAPANGAQNIRASSTASPTTANYALAISPDSTVGETRFATISANLRLSRTTNGASWRFDPQDPAAGLKTTLVQFDRAAARNIQAIVFDAAGNGTFVNTGAQWPVDTYFNFKVIVDRVNGALKMCVNDSSIYTDPSGNGTAGHDIANLAISQTVATNQTANNTFDVDDVVVEYQTTDDCVAPVIVTHTVTPSVGTPSGTISPATPQAVNDGDTATFTLTADADFEVDNVGGTCGGTLTGTSYTTNAVTADCTVVANFKAAQVIAPEAAITPTSLSLTAAEGASASLPLNIANVGGGSLDFTITESATASLPLEAVNPLALQSRDGRVSAGGVAPRANPEPSAVVIDEGFANVAALFSSGGWIEGNHSAPVGSAKWAQCGGTAIPPAFDGGSNDCILVNYCSTGNASCSGGSGVISNWLLTPEVTFNPGSTASFYTRTSTGADFADRLEVRVCNSGDCSNFGTGASDVGNFTTVLLTINPNQMDGPDPTGVNGYPDTWTKFTLNGLPSSGTGRIAFRYFVSSGGPAGAGSNIIGLDRVVVDNGTSGGGGCTNPSDIPWLSVSPLAGSVAGGSNTDVTVSVNAAGLATGTYMANVCVASNDPAAPMTTVPVSFTVTPPAVVTHTVTPSVGTPSGTISPATPQIVNDGASATFTLAADAGFEIDSVGGTCGGTLTGSSYVTNAVTADCTVVANFKSETGGNPEVSCINGSHPVTQDFDGTYVKWETGEFGDEMPGANFNPYGATNLTFFWPNSTAGNAGVVSSGAYPVLQSGDIVGATRTFATSATYAAWRATADGYLGFKFNCSTASICYGYAHLTTTGPNGFPATIGDYCWNKAGNQITVGETGGGGVTTHTVTPSVGSLSGTISPSTPQTVNDGATASFTLAADAGYEIDGVGGTCGGTLAGSSYTTNAVTADCTVIANFRPATPGGDLVCSGLINHAIANSIDGTSVNWITGDIQDADVSGYHFNPYNNSQQLTFWWQTGAPNIAGVSSSATSSDFLVLQDGAVVGPASIWSTTNNPGPAAWAAGADGYLGFRFNCSSLPTAPANGICYGYTHLTTTAPNGFPATLVDYCYDKAGNAVTIGGGTPGGDPVASITPTAISLSAEQGASDSKPLTIANTGGGSLTYTITESAVARPTSSFATAAVRTDKLGTPILGTLSANPNATRGALGRPVMLQATDISQMADNTPGDEGVACNLNDGSGVSDNSWWRRFYFNEHTTVGASANVVSVKVSTGSATLPGGVPSTINLYTIPHSVTVNTIPTAQLTLIGTANFTASGSLQTITVPVTGAINDTVGKDLVVEWNTAGATGGPFYPGANASAEMHPTFISSTGCGIAQPTPSAGIGFPDFHLTMVVTVEDSGLPPPVGCDNPSDIPWLSASPTSGTVAGNSSETVMVTGNAGSMAAGSYTANVCVATNDPAALMTTVPVTFTVTPPATANHTVTPSVAGSGGSISPSTPQTVANGATATFTLTPDVDFQIDTVVGTCGGTLTGNSYTTNPVTADCTVIASFKAAVGNPDVVCTAANHPVAQSFDGTYVKWETGEFSDTGSIAGANFNPYDSSGLAFFWPNSGTGNAGVGPSQTFSTATGAATNWRAGVDGYLGFRFSCSTASACYGYAHLTTTGPSGFPATIGNYCWNKAGNPITVGEQATPAAPSVSKAFTPATVATGQQSVATVTLSNPTAVDAVLTAPLVDTLPAGLAVSGATTSCLVDTGGAITPSASVTLPVGAVIPANGSCSIDITVSAAAVGTYVNTIAAGALVTDQGSNAEAASATLTVTVPVAEPTISVTPGSLEATQATNATTTRTLTIANVGTGSLDWTISEDNSRPMPVGSATRQPASERVGAAVSHVPATQGGEARPWAVPMASLYDNGPLVTNAGAGAGGKDASALQTSVGNSAYGSNVSASAGFRAADDFVVPAGGWTVDTMTFFTYQTGSTT
ncbi:MAG: S8 family serine peptidase, partial [Xanthomonadales bacterium]|nr:S8 family serine peptidase [Xanthomonadales bacterium]